MSAAVMPMRRVPCERAGIAVAAKTPMPAAAMRRRLNIRHSLVRRLPTGCRSKDLHMQVPSQAGRRRLPRPRHVDCMTPLPGGLNEFVDETANTRRIPRACGTNGHDADTG